jgi:hypothetical protein
MTIHWGLVYADWLVLSMIFTMQVGIIGLFKLFFVGRSYI